MNYEVRTIDCPAPVRLKTCHVIDLENQLFGLDHKVTEDVVVKWWGLYRQQAVGIGPTDVVYVGVSERNRWMLRALRDTKVRSKIGHSGPDGADLALLASVWVPHLVSRGIEKLVLATGDHLFAPLAVDARAHGLQVQIVASHLDVSAELKNAASIHTTIRSTSRAQVRRNLSAMQSVHAATLAA